jgi:hypothetical protein
MLLKHFQHNVPSSFGHHFLNLDMLLSILDHAVHVYVTSCGNISNILLKDVQHAVKMFSTCC